jgi:hypothetical protein
MRTIIVLILITASVAFAAPAKAGAAIGAPSSFMSPYPDYGCYGACLVRDIERHRLEQTNSAWRSGAERFSAHVKVMAK